MSHDQFVAIGTWFEHNGLRACKIDAVFTVFKICIIYMLMSVPFLFKFNGNTHDVEKDIEYDPSYSIVYGYLTFTYLAMSALMLSPHFDRIKAIVKCEKLFEYNGLDIQDTHGQSIDDILDRLGMNKEHFLRHNLNIENYIIAFDEKRFLETKIPFFKSLIETLPMEIAFKYLVKYHYLDSGARDYRKETDNSDSFKALSKRVGLACLPFLPVIFIFTMANHSLTYSNNGEMLSLNSYTRTGRWKFRYYNEFESRLKKRLQKTHNAAEAVLSHHFNNSWKAALYRLVSFIAGSVASMGLYLTFRGYARIFNVDLIPAIGILAMVSAVTFPRTKTHVNGLAYLKTMLKADLTIQELETMFSSKLTILIKELFSILLLPVLFFWYFQDRSYMIANFFSNWADPDGYCKISFFENKTMSAKTRASYTHASSRMGESDLLHL